MQLKFSTFSFLVCVFIFFSLIIQIATKVKHI